MGQDYFYLTQDDPRTPLGDKGEKLSRDGEHRIIKFRSGKRRVRRDSLSTSPPRLPGHYKTDDTVYALDTSKGSWIRGEKGKVLGSRTRGTLWVRFSDGKDDTHDVAPASLDKKRPRSPSPSISDSDLPDSEILEKDLRKKTGLLVRHFNPSYHYSYTSRNVKHMKRMRGGEGFVPPLGYTKLALTVDKFPDDGWLDKNDGWHVAYHGTRCRPCIIKSIVLEGFKVNGGKGCAANGTLFGEGVYCTPNPEKAEQYAKDHFVSRDDEEYLVMFLCRVRPRAYEVHTSKHWLVKDPRDIRPYGILLKATGL